jgi:hypothetical protein
MGEEATERPLRQPVDRRRRRPCHFGIPIVQEDEQQRELVDGAWREGAFQGQTEREAFFVNCGRETMTQDDIDSGRLVCEIGVAPTRPAEFVIFRIGQWTADAPH